MRKVNPIVVFPEKASSENKIIKYWQVLAILFIFLIFFFLRLYHLSFHDFWYDEIATVGYARLPLRNWNAPLYWILLHYWIKIFGISEFSLRFPSLLFSFFSVILVYLLGQNIFNKKVGIFASFFIGLSPLHLWYAQEARDYSMVLLIGLLSSLLFYRILEKGEDKLWPFFLLVSIIGFYTNYFYIFLFSAQFLYILFVRNLKLDFKAIIYFLIAILSFSFYLPTFLTKFFYVGRGFWIPRPEWRSLIITVENFILGYNGFGFLYVISNILAGLSFIFALIAAYKKKELRKNFIFCLILFFTPIICIFFFSKIFFSIYLDRALIIFSPYFYLILSLGIVFLNRTVRIVLVTILITAILIADYGYFNDWLFMHHHVGACIKKPIKPIAKFLDEHIEPQDIVGFTHESSMLPLYFYMQKKLFFSYYFFDPRFLDSSWRRPRLEGAYQLPFYKINQLEFKRLWVISSNWVRSGEWDEEFKSIKNWLDKNYKLEFINLFDGLWVFRYVKDAGARNIKQHIEQH